MPNAHAQNDWEGQSMVHMVGIIKNHQVIHSTEYSVQSAKYLASYLLSLQNFDFRTYVAIVHRCRELGYGPGDKLFKHCQVDLLNFND